MPGAGGVAVDALSSVTGAGDVGISVAGAGGGVESPSGATAIGGCSVVVAVSDPAVVDATSEMAASVAAEVVVVTTAAGDAEVEGGGVGAGADASREFVEGENV